MCHIPSPHWDQDRETTGLSNEKLFSLVLDP